MGLGAVRRGVCGTTERATSGARASFSSKASGHSRAAKPSRTSGRCAHLTSCLSVSSPVCTIHLQVLEAGIVQAFDSASLSIFGRGELSNSLVRSRFAGGD